MLELDLVIKPRGTFIQDEEGEEDFLLVMAGTGAGYVVD